MFALQEGADSAVSGNGDSLLRGTMAHTPLYYGAHPTITAVYKTEFPTFPCFAYRLAWVF